MPSIQQFEVIEAFLARETSLALERHEALRELAALACATLDAQEAVVAVWQSDTAQWSAVTHRGERLDERSLTGTCSRSVLDQVRVSAEPVIAQALPATDSIHRLGIRDVLAIPLFGLDPRSKRPRRRIVGCLYAHRTAPAPFSHDDVRCGLMIARIAQPTLNALEYLHRLREDLHASEAERNRLRDTTAPRFELEGFATADPQLARAVLDPLRMAATADRINLLLLGPTGAGKTHLAEAFHRISRRREGRFMVVDCAQISSELVLGAELFGYGRLSGFHDVPREGRPGKALLAHEGTLFIDEIGCLPLELQGRLLRLVEVGRFTPLGGTEEVKVDVQIVAATNRPLETLVKKGAFREDLYWRLGEVVLRLPPLSDRIADLPGLIDKMLCEERERLHRPEVQGLTPAALSRLLEVDWGRAGNLRGLKRTLTASLLLLPTGSHFLDEAFLRLPQEITLEDDGLPASRSPNASVEDAMLRRIISTIHETRNARTAARSLGLTYRQLIYRLECHRLTVKGVLSGQK